MAREDERSARAAESPIIGSLPPVPGILAAMRLSPGIGAHLRGLADALLVEDFPGATLTRADREMLATAVSAANDCFYCMDSHGAFAGELLAREGTDPAPLVDAIKCGRDAGSPKLAALLAIARTVARGARTLTREQVQRALDAGATDADTQLAVLIAAAFAMYNRMVDGLRAPTPPREDAYAARAVQIADGGYAAPTAIPGA